MRVAVSRKQISHHGLRIHKSLPVKEEFAKSDYLNLVRDLFPKVNPKEDKISISK